MKNTRKLKKALALVLFCTILTVSVLSVGVSAVRTTVGPFYTAEYYASGVMMYKYTTAIHTSTLINMSLDGKNYINKIAMGSDYVKEVSTYACIYKGAVTDSRFNDGNFFDEPATSTTLNKGKITVEAYARYYSSGALIMETKTKTEESKNWAYVKAGSMLTSKALSSYGYIEYENNDKTLYNYVSTVDY